MLWTLQPGQSGSFKTVLNVEGDAYWLQHQAMRSGPFRAPLAGSVARGWLAGPAAPFMLLEAIL